MFFSYPQLFLLLTTCFFHPIHALSVSGIQARNITTSLADRGIQKRFGDAKFTFFDPGLGACGGTNSNSDFIVALNAPQWDGGSHCFQTITITFEGKTHDAQIVDLCPSCPFGGLDMSRSLFDAFASQDRGVIFGSWDFGSGGGGGNGNENGNGGGDQQTSSPPPPPPLPETTTTTSTQPPLPPKTTATTSTSSTASAATSRTTSSETSSSTSATPAETGSPLNPDGAFAQLLFGIGNLGAIAVAGATVPAIA